VKVRVYAMLRRYVGGVAPGQAIELELPAGGTVGDALDKLGIPRAETKLCFVSGRHQDLTYCLRDGDELAVFPPVAGGSARA
jgi:molybdopterin converting factor small subunit